jgi:hypothetical protein
VGALDASRRHVAHPRLLRHHLYSALLASVIEKNGILESIFTGFKWVRAEEVEKE